MPSLKKLHLPFMYDCSLLCCKRSQISLLASLRIQMAAVKAPFPFSNLADYHTSYLSITRTTTFLFNHFLEKGIIAPLPNSFTFRICPLESVSNIPVTLFRRSLFCVSSSSFCVFVAVCPIIFLSMVLIQLCR